MINVQKGILEQHKMVGHSLNVSLVSATTTMRYHATQRLGYAHAYTIHRVTIVILVNQTIMDTLLVEPHASGKYFRNK